MYFDPIFDHNYASKRWNQWTNRTEKHAKSDIMDSKTRIISQRALVRGFGSRMPQVRILSLRPSGALLTVLPFLIVNGIPRPKQVPALGCDAEAPPVVDEAFYGAPEKCNTFWGEKEAQAAKRRFPRLGETIGRMLCADVWLPQHGRYRANNGLRRICRLLQRGS